MFLLANGLKNVVMAWIFKFECLNYLVMTIKQIVIKKTEKKHK